MSELYRLAVIDTAAGTTPVIERDGVLLPLALILELGDGGGILADLAPLLTDWPRWSAILPERVAAAGNRFKHDGVKAEHARYRPVIMAPGKIVCIGANYHDHIAEMKIPMAPTYPYAFLKPPSTTLRGSGEAVVAPAGVSMMDWEAELAVVIGTRARDVKEADALGVVAGYANFNDLSARDWLANRPAVGIDWVRHKCWDGFAPIGPYLVPAEFVPDPQALPIALTVNGAVKQRSNTQQMVFGVAAIIAHLSTIMTLEPGDIIATGTPAGCAAGQASPEWLKVGDEVRIEIGALGTLVTPIVAPRIAYTNRP